MERALLWGVAFRKARREEFMKVTYLLLAVAMALPIDAVAEQPDRSRLIGSPIYSSDGAEVGIISDIRLDEGGKLSSVRIDAAARLGFGTRQVEIPGRAVTIVRGAAVLALPKEAIEIAPWHRRTGNERRSIADFTQSELAQQPAGTRRSPSC